MGGNTRVENADGIKVPVRESWLIRAKRDAVYRIISDFEAMPRNFPKVAHKISILNRDGNRLTIEAESASFGRFFPRARVAMMAELLPGMGYRCQTRGITFNTRGEEELLLVDDPEGTRIQYTYIVTVRNKRFAPLYAWLVRTFALPFWKHAFVDQLEVLLGIAGRRAVEGNCPEVRHPRADLLQMESQVRPSSHCVRS